MPKFTLSQYRTGEGAHLARYSHQSLSELTTTFEDLFDGGLLLIAGEELTASDLPSSAKERSPGLFEVPGKEAKSLVHERLADDKLATLIALVPTAPDEQVLGRSVAEALRPWDHERLATRLYAQQGKRYAHRGVHLADDRDRERFITSGLEPVLTAAGHAMPPGDPSLVFDLPAESTFEATFRYRGTDDGFRISRDFGEKGLAREWWIDRGEWKGEERRRPKGDAASLGSKVVQGVATGAILAASVPVAMLVGLSLLTTKLADVSGTNDKAPAGH